MVKECKTTSQNNKRDVVKRFLSETLDIWIHHFDSAVRKEENREQLIEDAIVNLHSIWIDALYGVRTDALSVRLMIDAITQWRFSNKRNERHVLELCDIRRELETYLPVVDSEIYESMTMSQAFVEDFLKCGGGGG